MRDVRDVFAVDPSDELHRALKIKAKDRTERLLTATVTWGDKAILQLEIDFMQRMLAPGLDVLRGILDEMHLKGNIEFFQASSLRKPGGALRCALSLAHTVFVFEADPFHVDALILGFSVADTSGVLVQDLKGKASRVPIIKDELNLVKGLQYKSRTNKLICKASRLEVADKGRASTVSSVYNPIKG